MYTYTRYLNFCIIEINDIDDIQQMGHSALGIYVKWKAYIHIIFTVNYPNGGDIQRNLIYVI